MESDPYLKVQMRWYIYHRTLRIKKYLEGNTIFVPSRSESLVSRYGRFTPVESDSSTHRMLSKFPKRISMKVTRTQGLIFVNGHYASIRQPR